MDGDTYSAPFLGYSLETADPPAATGQPAGTELVAPIV